MYILYPWKFKTPFLYCLYQKLYKNNLLQYFIIMINDELIKENQLLKEELEKTKHILVETQEHLKKYTAPASRREYYERNKEKEKQRAKEYQQKTNYKSDYKPTPEQKKEYNRREYLKRKEKLKKEMEEKQNDENI